MVGGREGVMMSAGKEVESKLHALAVTYLKIPCLFASSLQNSCPSANMLRYFLLHCEILCSSTFYHRYCMPLCQRPQKFSAPCQMLQTLLVLAAAETLPPCQPPWSSYLMLQEGRTKTMPAHLSSADAALINKA